MGLRWEKGSRYSGWETISEGAFQGFFRCKDAKTGQVVAILRTEYNEATLKMLTALNQHPNILKCQAVFRKSGNQMELVFEYFDTLTKFDGSVNQVDRILQQLRSGLHHFCSCGIIPKFLNPSNVLLNNDGIVKIAYFEHVKAPLLDQRRGLGLMERLRALKSCCSSFAENVESQSPPASVVKLEESCNEFLAEFLRNVPHLGSTSVKSPFADDLDGPSNHI